MQEDRWVCYDCQYPKCKSCNQRPDFIPSHNSKDKDGQYLCTACRRPPCNACKTAQRPPDAKYNVERKPVWICAACTTALHPQFVAGYEKVREWKRKPGREGEDCWPVQKSSIPEERTLAKFINHQRTDYWADPQQYPEAKKRLLDEFPGIWDPRSEKWFRNCADSQKFKDANAGRRPNKRAANPEERRLGKWIDNQQAAAGTFTNAQKKAWKQLMK